MTNKNPRGPRNGECAGRAAREGRVRLGADRQTALLVGREGQRGVGAVAVKGPDIGEGLGRTARAVSVADVGVGPVHGARLAPGAVFSDGMTYTTVNFHTAPAFLVLPAAVSI